MKTDWKKYEEGNYILHPYATCHWQVKLLEKDGESVYTNVYEYPPIAALKSSTYQVDMWIPDKLNVVGKDINISLFSYDVLDLPRFKRHAEKVMKALKVGDEVIIRKMLRIAKEQLSKRYDQKAKQFLKQ